MPDQLTQALTILTLLGAGAVLGGGLTWLTGLPWWAYGPLAMLPAVMLASRHV